MDGSAVVAERHGFVRALFCLYFYVFIGYQWDLCYVDYFIGDDVEIVIAQKAEKETKLVK